MNDAKKKISTAKKIESPLAKYTESGHLLCVLCKTIVRSEIVWPIHLNSKNHKENVELTRKSIVVKEKPKETLKPMFKRPSSPIHDKDSFSSKKIKGILKDTSDVKPRDKLPADFFDVAPGHQSTVAVALRTTEKSEIPSTERTTEEGIKEGPDIKDDNGVPSLPEGFFDDPKLDAKVRNVDYKDPIEEEWDKFQKEIKEEAAQSAQIIADDQEEATTVRQLDEIEEQMRNWTRVMNFVKLKDQVRTIEKKTDSVGEEDSSGEEEDYDEFLDWRAKNSY